MSQALWFCEHNAQTGSCVWGWGGKVPRKSGIGREIREEEGECGVEIKRARGECTDSHILFH